MSDKAALSAGERVRAIREALHHSRPEFADLLDFDVKRLGNIENGRARLGDDLLEKICPMFPELTAWIAYGGDISLSGIRASENSMVRLFAAQIDAGMAPEDGALAQALVD